MTLCFHLCSDSSDKDKATKPAAAAEGKADGRIQTLGVVSDWVAAGGDGEGVERRGELCQGIHLLQSSKIGALKRERLKKQTDRCYHNMCNPKPCVKSNSEFYTDGGLITT